ncbi:leucyl aminopeptidase [Geoalkalibacter halelectricus]|uniref:Probable cytosol aminopeptidase n=1 Tax=Geoalkalibacter halelectricus TaxID=2847045 RepID=A0ABY5ZLG7_9BACT|nr:leucyl aminopeptidase [Geoalkalibacter halelectricus]MDO3378678.1 leucyl aminopeptidase [Geoalkalibacter halelectricus]UWZ80012.1 leucyl aminopeptidase [Geoalkalibacter halelectricus]
MEFKVKKADPLKRKTPVLVVGVFEDKLKGGFFKKLDAALDGLLQQAIRSGEFRGEFKETLLLATAGKISAQRILAVGLGREGEADLDRLRQGSAVAAALLQQRRLTTLSTNLTQVRVKGAAAAEVAQAVGEGLLLAAYRFDRYRTEQRDKLPPVVSEVCCLVDEAAAVEAVEQGVAVAQAVAAGVYLTRDLVNEPGNVKSPLYLAAQAQALAKELGFACTVLGREELERQGFGALLGVARGSEREPCLIVLEYQGGKKEQPPVALVGKGVVFDAGGISLKPAEKMDEMKMDMAGAAAVLGTFKAAAQARLPVNLVGVIPAVENLPSGTAMRPGDILTSLSGRTIEVLNTDAEGRLILADALTYVKGFKPRAVIDLATLTGACIIALGHHAAAVLGTGEKLIEDLLAAGRASGEKLWQLPLWEEYAGQIKSEIADVKNLGGRPAGTITAAAFLKKFADDLNWAHLDIAGTAWEEKGEAWIPRGASGFGVRLLMRFLQAESGLK